MTSAERFALDAIVRAAGAELHVDDVGDRSRLRLAVTFRNRTAVAFVDGELAAHPGALGRVVRQMVARAGASVPDDEAAPAAASSAGDVPVIEGEVVGFREWRLVDGLLRPRGMWAMPPWVPGVNVATCGARVPVRVPGRDALLEDAYGPPGHLAPDEHCDCGLYGLAWAQPGWSEPSIFAGPPPVAGAMRAWGDQFYFHPTGFRAEYAEPVLLSVAPGAPVDVHAAVRAAAATYGCDVVEMGYLQDAAREHGQLVPRELLPKAEPPHPDVSRFVQHVMRTDTASFRDVSKAMADMARSFDAVRGVSLSTSKAVEQMRRDHEQLLAKRDARDADGPLPWERARAKFMDSARCGPSERQRRLR